jgi:cytochrome c oxidase subunit 2
VPGAAGTGAKARQADAGSDNWGASLMVNGSLRERMRARVRAAVLGALSAGLGSLAAVGPAAAGTGQPSPKQMGFQTAVTPVAHDIHWLHDYVNIIIFAITVFVLVLMLYVMWRFSEKRNPVPSRTTHNTTIEVLWTVLPVFVLVAIAIPPSNYPAITFPPPDLTAAVATPGAGRTRPRQGSASIRDG